MRLIIYICTFYIARRGFLRLLMFIFRQEMNKHSGWLMLFLSQFYSETGLQPETDRYPLVDKGGNLLKLKVKARKDEDLQI